MDFGILLNDVGDVDRAATLLLNHDGGMFEDNLWWMFSSRLVWLPVAAVFLYEIFAGRRRTGWAEAAIVLSGLALTVYLADAVSASVCKPLFARLRPSHDPSFAGLLHFVGGYRGGPYGFVSSHAANSFGVFVYVAMLFRRRLVVLALLLFVTCVCYSRIYLGVHYLGDILGGCVLGSAFGLGVFFLVVKMCRLFRRYASVAVGPRLVWSSGQFVSLAICVSFLFVVSLSFGSVWCAELLSPQGFACLFCIR